MSHSSEAIDDVLDVEGVARLPVPAAKVCISCPIRTLNPDNKAVYVQQHIMEDCWVHMIFYLQSQLLKLGGLWQLDEAVKQQ